MTRNKRFHRPDEYDISWSSSGSENEAEPKLKNKNKWINLRILTPHFSPKDGFKRKSVSSSPIRITRSSSEKLLSTKEETKTKRINKVIRRTVKLNSTEKSKKLGCCNNKNSPLIFTDVENDDFNIFSSHSTSLIGPVKSNSVPIIPSNSPILFSTYKNRKSNEEALKIFNKFPVSISHSSYRIITPDENNSTSANVSQSSTMDKNIPTPVNISQNPSQDENNANISLFSTPEMSVVETKLLNASPTHKQRSINIPLNSSPIFVRLEAELSPVINNTSVEKSPIIGKKRKSVMRQLVKYVNTSQDIFSTQYDIDDVETQRTAELNEFDGCIQFQENSFKHPCEGNLSVNFEAALDIVSQETRQSLKLGEILDETQSSLKLGSVKSFYEIDNVSSQDVEEITIFDDPLANDFSETEKSMRKRRRYKKGGFASQTLAAIKHQEADVHIWRHEMYLQSVSGEEVLCVKPELVRKFRIIRIVEEYGCRIALCENERLRCFVMMENCDSGDVKIGREFRLFPPYAVKQILETNVCYDVYLSVTKIMFND